jgi:hypothetical protein
MANTLVQQNVANVSTQASQNVVLNGVSAGNSLVVAVIADSASGITVSSITINGESNATLHGTEFNVSVSGPRVQMIRFGSLGNVTAGGNKTITATLSAAPANFALYAAEVSGGDTASFFDAVGTGTTGSGTTISDSITTGSANSSVFCFVACDGSEATAGTGYTGIALINMFWWHEGQYDMDVGGAGAQTPQMTQSSGNWGMLSAAFKTAGGGGGGAYNAVPAIYRYTLQRARKLFN